MSGTINPPDGGGSGARNPPVVRQRVLAPPKAGLLKDIKSVVEETFFHDAPLRDFKGQTPAKKALLGIQAVFPIIGWAREYTLRKFRGDLIAGLTIASLCIPQDIGYAKLANVDPKYGLYSSFVPPLIYAGMGSSRDIAIGPVAVVSLLVGTLCQAVIDPKKNPEDYLRLVFTATFFAGIFQAGLGFLRLGFLIDFLSHAAVVGFMGGAAITIALQQLKGFLGIKTFTKKTDIVSVMHSVFKNAEHGWNWQTIVIGASFLTFLLVTKFIGKRNRKLFWVPAIAPLISVIISTFFVFIFRADKQGVQIVKHIDQGINPISVHKIFFSGKYFTEGIRIGGIAGMVALTEAVAIARTFAAMKDYQIDGNKEMIALGTMNVVGSMTSCYIATGSFSRSAVNFMAGVETAVSNIVMAIVVALTLEFITPLFKYTPNAILAAIIISAVLGLIDIDAAILIWRIDKLDFLACMGAFLGVIFISVEIGLLIAVVISFAKILLQVTRPRTTVLGKLPNSNVYRNTLQYPDAAQIPGILIIRVDSAIYFSNSNYVRERASRWVREEQENAKEYGMPAIRFVIIEMSPVTDIDTSGIHSIEELLKSLEKQEIQLILANPGPVVIERKPKPDAILSISLLTTVSSPPSPPSDPLISDAVSILTHHRSKSRWSTLRSLQPSGFTPSQFSEITLCLRNNPHLSLRFFLFTRRYSLCSHDTHSCSTLIHILSRSRLKSHASEIIRLALRLAATDEDEDRVLKVFRSLIKSYNRCGSAPFVFDLLIKSCLDSKEIDGAVMVMRKLRSRGINAQISTCNALITEVSRRRGASNGYKMYREVFGLDDVSVDEAKKMIGKIKPNATTFNSMMVSFYREGETEMVERIWREMEEEVGCSPNVYSYNVLMEAYCARGLMSEAEKVWEEMKVRGVVYDIVAYNTMIGGLCSNFEVVKAKELFRDMGLKGIECTCLTYEHLVNGYCKAGDVDSGLVVYREMKRKGFEADGLTIEALVEGLCDDRDGQRVVEAADIVKDAVREAMFYPSRNCYELLVKRLCEDGKMDRALNIQAEMVGKGFKPSQETYRAFIDGYGIVGDEETSALLAIEMAESLKLRAEEES